MKPKIYQEWVVERTSDGEYRKLKMRREVSILPPEAENQNNDTEVTGLIYELKGKKDKTPPSDTEAKSPSSDEAKKAELWEQINKMDVDEKPHHLSGIKKLEDFIAKNS